MNKKSAVILFLLFFSACSGTIAEEKEPNNSFETAQWINIGDILEGKLQNGADEDVYFFEVDEPNYYCFSLTGVKGFDLMFRIFNQEKKVVIMVDDFFKNFGEVLPNLYLMPGKYYIKVSVGLNDYKIGRPVVVMSDKYQLKVNYLRKMLGKSHLNFEKKPNNTIESAQELKVGEVLFGYYYPLLNYMNKSKVYKQLTEEIQKKVKKDFSERNAGFYHFSIPNTGNYLLQLELSPVEDFDSTIIVFDQKYLHFLSLTEEQKKEISLEGKGSFFVVDSNSFDKGEGLANYRIRGNNKYYIMIVALNRLNYETDEKIVKNPYQLKYNISPMSSDMGAKPSNTFETANKIETNVIKGYLNPINDKDFYILESSEEIISKLNINEEKFNKQLSNVYRSVNITVIPPDNVDIAIDIYDQEKRLQKSIDNEGKGGIEKIPNLIVYLNTQTYICIRAGKTNDQDNFKVPYELKLFFNDKDTEELEYEPNDDTLQNQGPNTFNDCIKSYINNKGDVDNFYNVILERGSLFLNLKAVPNATFILEIYDSNGFFVQKAMALKPGMDVSIENFIARGQIYNFRVYTQEKNFFNIEQPYYLCIGSPEEEE